MRTKVFAILIIPCLIWIWCMMKLFGFYKHDDITLWGVIVDTWEGGIE